MRLPSVSPHPGTHMALGTAPPPCPLPLPQGSNSISNSYVPLVAKNKECVPVAMALYNSVANLVSP